MTVLLRRYRDVGGIGKIDNWAAVPSDAALDIQAPLIADLGKRLEEHFADIGETWWRLGRSIGAEPTAEIAHTPTCGAYGSDFGLMLAWESLIREVAEKEGVRTLVVCDDPWVFRHLATIQGVDAGKPPPLFPRAIKLFLRGLAARTKVAVSVAIAAVRLAALRKNSKRNAPVILVYGHPASRADGYDDYFGSLMNDEPTLVRVLHSDCPVAFALELGADRRTCSLHAWGSALFALTRLPFVRWKRSGERRGRDYGWLVERAQALENGGGGPAMNAWQHHCQASWMADVQPSVIMWPWENHGWERALCRSAKSLALMTVGYQHTTIGPYQYNYSARSNVEPELELPRLIIANGPKTKAEMVDWHIPEERIRIGGAFRLPRWEHCPYDPDGPVFIPLSADSTAAAAQLSAAKLLADSGFEVVVKEHPMYPQRIAETENLKATDADFSTLLRVSALIYASGTMGLQGILAGVPTIRLRMPDGFGMNVLPRGIRSAEATMDDLVQTLSAIEPAKVEWDEILSPVDHQLWRRVVHSNTRAYEPISSNEPETKHNEQSS